jgi:hypothetical protein
MELQSESNSKLLAQRKHGNGTLREQLLPGDPGRVNGAKIDECSKSESMEILNILFTLQSHPSDL